VEEGIRKSRKRSMEVYIEWRKVYEKAGREAWKCILSEGRHKERQKEKYGKCIEWRKATEKLKQEDKYGKGIELRKA
jgi:hypothetical protein